MIDGKAFGEEIVGLVRDYVDGQTGPQLTRIADLENQLAALPTPKDGADGRDGTDGRDGKDAEVTEQLLEAAVRRYIEANPPPPGRDGADGKDGRDGEEGLPGEPGERGKDGADVIEAFIERDGALVLTLSDGRTKTLGVVVGRDGRDGVDGRDGERGERGFSLEDFGVEKTDERTILLKFTRGDVLESHELHFPAMIYRGVFKDGEGYAQGDVVTWAGSLWHCDTETAEKPGESGKAWTLAAKRGRDGKDGEPGKPGEPGQKGDPGRDGRSHP